MLLDEDRVTEAARFQRQRCTAFGATTAEKIRAAQHCQFSFLPYEELARLASSWYDASAQVMLNGNYAPIQAWAQVQAELAAGQNFELEDVLELLRLCRSAAIQGEKWSEDIFSAVDDAINEALQSIPAEVAWTIPATLNYVSGNARQTQPAARPHSALPATAQAVAPERLPEPSEPRLENWSDDRRDFGRNCLRLPIRVRASDDKSIDEVTCSQNVSRSGLYFVTRNSSYKMQMPLRVTYPYWIESGAINREYRAKIVRLDRRTGGSFGVAVEFTESLGPRRD